MFALLLCALHTPSNVLLVVSRAYRLHEPLVVYRLLVVADSG